MLTRNGLERIVESVASKHDYLKTLGKKSLNAHLVGAQFLIWHQIFDMPNREIIELYPAQGRDKSFLLRSSKKRYEEDEQFKAFYDEVYTECWEYTNNKTN